MGAPRRCLRTLARLSVRGLRPAFDRLGLVVVRDFSAEWREVKAVFVDSPVEAVHHADRLLSTIMKTRGFPMADFDRRYEDLTVDHREVASHYRAGHEIAERQGRGEATTEDLRQAMKHYEALFDDLTRDGAGETATVRTTQAGI